MPTASASMPLAGWVVKPSPSRTPSGWARKSHENGMPVSARLEAAWVIRIQKNQMKNARKPIWAAHLITVMFR